MARLSRHGWAEVLAQDRPVLEPECLAHWKSEGPPLVVTSQDRSNSDFRIALGLPAPGRWQLQRISIEVSLSGVDRLLEGPCAEQIATLLPEQARQALGRLTQVVRMEGSRLEIYGSYGWQWMTDLDHVHPDSDLDVLAHVQTALQADRVALLLSEVNLGGVRVDGELCFASGECIAWREWRAWRSGAVRSVVVKRLSVRPSSRRWANCRRLREPPAVQGSAKGPIAHLAPHDIARAAVLSLYDELSLAPKPGLVSFLDSGSHDDMDAHTFLRSLFALRGYFAEIAVLGARGAHFASLESCGIAAEERMMAATGGVNTHRGAIFMLGLLCAAAGASRGRTRANEMRQTLSDSWGTALARRSRRRSKLPGGVAARRHGLRSASEETASDSRCCSTLHGLHFEARSPGV